MMRNKFTRDQIIDGLRQAGGMITHAAPILGCCYETIERYIRNDPTIADELKAIKEARLDTAESKLLTLMKSEEDRIALDAVKFYLKYVGQSRGYRSSRVVEITNTLSDMMQAADKRENS